MSFPHLHGHRVLRLSLTYAGALQLLYERCSDYHEEHEGTPTRPTAAAEELAALPPGKAPVDKFSLGIYSPDGEMIGYLDLVRDFPFVGEWQIGLLMLDPAVRGAGLGERVCRAAEGWVAEQGGRSISLGVLEHAAGAERFWRRMGFDEVARQPYASETGRKHSRIIFMRRSLVDRR